METLKLTLAAVLFVTSINFNEQIIKTSENALISKWSLTLGIQSASSVVSRLEKVNFE